METEEFEHYFRICLARTITSEEARDYLFAVDDIAEAEPDDEDVVMVYHQDEDTKAHCYDVRLRSDITGEQGDQILSKLEAIFPEDDFECESSMDMMSEQEVLNRAVMEQLTKTIF